MPVVTTLHTVLREPSSDQRRVMRELGQLSSRLVVMSQRGREFLLDEYLRRLNGDRLVSQVRATLT
jgi:hypothetical protein